MLLGHGACRSWERCALVARPDTLLASSCFPQLKTEVKNPPAVSLVKPLLWDPLLGSHDPHAEWKRTVSPFPKGSAGRDPTSFLCPLEDKLQVFLVLCKGKRAPASEGFSRVGGIRQPPTPSVGSQDSRSDAAQALVLSASTRALGREAAMRTVWTPASLH